MDLFLTTSDRLMGKCSGRPQVLSFCKCPPKTKSLFFKTLPENGMDESPLSGRHVLVLSLLLRKSQDPGVQTQTWHNCGATRAQITFFLRLLF